MFSRIVMPVYMGLFSRSFVLRMCLPAMSFPKIVNLSKDGLRQQLADLVIFPVSVSHYLHVNTVPQVFHRLTKHRVVHQLVEVRFKIDFSLAYETSCSS